MDVDQSSGQGELEYSKRDQHGRDTQPVDEVLHGGDPDIVSTPHLQPAPHLQPED